MKNLLYNSHKVKVYDSVDEMPICNFQKYNKYLLIDAGIGSDADDIDEHITKVARYIKAGSNKKALQELQNMRQAMYMVNNSISPKYLAFAALVHSIDDKKVNDLSDDGLKLLLKQLKEVKHASLLGVLVWLKKKVSTELDMYFPGEFSNAKEKEAYDKIKARTMLVLDSIVSGADNKKKINDLDLALLNMSNPKNYYGSESVEIAYDKQFEDACLIISQKMNTNAKDMTVLQFYNALDNIKKQAEAETKGLKKHHPKHRK